MWRQWGGGRERFAAWVQEFVRSEALRGLRCSVPSVDLWMGFAGDVP